MQVEAKLSVSDERSFVQLAEGFRRALGAPTSVLRQRNVFFDGASGELASVHAVCRVRTQSVDPAPPAAGSSTVVLKEHNEVEDGSSARFVIEAPMPDGSAYETNLTHVDQLVKSTVVGEAIATRFGAIQLRCVGSFDNVRTIHKWPFNPETTLELRLDRTTYSFGDRFEIEVRVPHTVMVDEVLQGVQELAKQVGVSEENLELAERSKFDTFSEGMASYTAGSASKMTVEAKVLLSGREAYERVLARNIEKHQRTFSQRNAFFDTLGGELSKAGVYLRVRLDGGSSYSVALKEHSEVSEGSGLSWVQQDEIASDVAEALLETHELGPLLQLRSCSVATALMQRFGLTPQTSLKLLGNFDNRRSIFAWPAGEAIQAGLVLRVDETTFNGNPADLRHEVEVSGIAVPVHDVLDALSDDLAKLGVSCTLSEKSKYQEMVARIVS